MTTKRLILEIDNKKQQPREKVKIKESTKRKEHLKKFIDKLKDESKVCGSNLSTGIVSLFKCFLYTIIIFGDLLLIGLSQNKKKQSNTTKEQKKNILDEGW